MEVVDPDEDDDENTGTVLIGLMQKARRKLKKEGGDMLTMGYVIYKVRTVQKLYTCRHFSIDYIKNVLWKNLDLSNLLTYVVRCWYWL